LLKFCLKVFTPKLISKIKPLNFHKLSLSLINHNKTHNSRTWDLLGSFRLLFSDIN